jgi:hypothetical protein
MGAPETAAHQKPSDLAADLQTRSCPVCNHVVKTARDFFAQWQYALSRDDAAQKTFATELGFCARHMWQLHAMSSPWGESVGIAPLTERISRELAEILEQRLTAIGKPPLVANRLCRVCAMLKEAEATYLKSLANFVSTEQGRQIYQRSHGVCLLHLGRLLETASKGEHKFLLTNASRRFAEFAKGMRSYAAKREAVRRDLITTDEEDASLRALIHIAGAQEYSAP